MPHGKNGPRVPSGLDLRATVLRHATQGRGLLLKSESPLIVDNQEPFSQGFYLKTKARMAERIAWHAPSRPRSFTSAVVEQEKGRRHWENYETWLALCAAPGICGCPDLPCIPQQHGLPCACEFYTPSRANLRLSLRRVCRYAFTPFAPLRACHPACGSLVQVLWALPLTRAARLAYATPSLLVPTRTGPRGTARKGRVLG
jgi:hypothetical protein